MKSVRGIILTYGATKVYQFVKKPLFNFAKSRLIGLATSPFVFKAIRTGSKKLLNLTRSSPKLPSK